MMKNRVKVTMITALIIGVATLGIGMVGRAERHPYSYSDGTYTHTGYWDSEKNEFIWECSESENHDHTNLKAPTHILTFMGNGGTFNRNSSLHTDYTEYYNEGTASINLPEPTWEGYQFDGWYYNNGNGNQLIKPEELKKSVSISTLFPGTTQQVTLTAGWTQVVNVTLDGSSAGTVVAGHTYVVTPAASDKLTLDKWVVNDSTDVVPLGDNKSGSITVKAATAENHVINIDGDNTGFGITSENPNANFVSYWSPKDEYYLVEVTNKTGHPLKFNHKTIENNATSEVELFGIIKGFPEKTGDNYFTILNRQISSYIKDQAGDYTSYDGHKVKFYSVTLNAENVKRNIAVKYKQIDGVNYTYTVGLNKEVNYNSSAISPQDLLNITVTGGKVEAKKDGFTKYRWTYAVKDINGNSIAAESIPAEAWADSQSENILEKKFNYSFPYYEFEFAPVWQGDVNFSLDIPTGESATKPDVIEGVDVGTKITLPDGPEIEGYTFNGWKLNAATDTKSYEPGSSYEITSANVTFTGSWSVNAYKITWNSENGEEFEPYEVEYKSTINEFPIPEKTGYTFTGWKSDVEDDSNLYNKENPFTMPHQNVTMTAQWEINRYTVTYDGNGGTIGIYTGTDTVTYNDSYEIKQASGITPTRYGYNFLGWKIDNEGETFPVNGSFIMPARNITLVAQWKLKSPNLNNKGTHGLSRGVGYNHDGAFRIKGDPNNYQDKITFYVPNDGEFTFE